MDAQEPDEGDPLLRHYVQEQFTFASKPQPKREYTHYRRRRPFKWLVPKHDAFRLDAIAQYLPFIGWISQYRLEWFPRDIMGAVTVASLYIPLSIPFALLGHADPLSGLYSFVINPLIYAMLGSCPQMIVGPEAPGSLLVGSVVMLSNRNSSGHVDEAGNAEVAGVVTAFAGAVLFSAGLSRLGFLECVINRAFMRGFICAVGFTVLVEQAIPEFGLRGMKDEALSEGSVASKLIFILGNLNHAHLLTMVVSISSFALVMILRLVKHYAKPRYPSIAYLPDRFLVIAFSAALTWKFNWHEQGLEILGHIRSPGPTANVFIWPFQLRYIFHVPKLIGTSSMIALLGLFESTLTAKSLIKDTTSTNLQKVSLRINQELIALGGANILGGCFKGLPAFGGYGRSKLNVSVGGSTPMSSILLSAIALACILWLLPALHYIPKGVLAAMMSVVGCSMIEECPHDLIFFAKIRGWTELGLMAIVFGSTIFHSMELGMALGIGLCLVAIIRNARKSDIHIVDLSSQAGPQTDPRMNELVANGSMVIKIPGQLSFANSTNLKDRLEDLEQQWTMTRQQSLDVRDRHQDLCNKTIMFVGRGAINIDGCATQLLKEVVEDYVCKGKKIIFCWLDADRRGNFLIRLKMSGILGLCGGSQNFVTKFEDGLALLKGGYRLSRISAFEGQEV